MGYSAESSVERGYRDSRINRIFEGTNEINRMLIVDMVLRRAMKGELDLMGPAMAVANELMSIPEFGDAPEGILGNEQAALKGFQKSNPNDCWFSSSKIDEYLIKRARGVDGNC